MNAFLPVMLGGALGAGARYALALAAARAWGATFPWGTLIANLAGGLAMGVLAGLLSRGGSEGLRLFLGVGVLGGFTTFSAFGLESWAMVERGAMAAAAAYVFASVTGAILFTGLGLWLARA